MRIVDPALAVADGHDATRHVRAWYAPSTVPRCRSPESQPSRISSPEPVRCWSTARVTYVTPRPVADSRPTVPPMLTGFPVMTAGTE